MPSEIIKAVIQRILRDKILLGLVIVAILGVFVGGLSMGDDKPEKAKKEAASEQRQAAVLPANALDPKQAGDFVAWWLNSAMDYSAQTAQQSHNQALSWMSPDAARNFEATFWTPQVAQAIATGQLVAAFQPTSIQPQAINPDGSVVVGVAGTMVVQANGQAMPQQFLASFLVRKEKDGLRVAGLDPRAGSLTAF